MFSMSMRCYLTSVHLEQALLSAIVKRVKGFIKLRIALGTLHGALPDATLEELQTYDDECAICRVSPCPSSFLVLISFSFLYDSFLL